MTLYLYRQMKVYSGVYPVVLHCRYLLSDRTYNDAQRALKCNTPFLLRKYGGKVGSLAMSTKKEAPEKTVGGPIRGPDLGS